MVIKNWFIEKYRENHWLWLVLAVSFLVFLQVVWHEFVDYDDPSNIFQNPHITDCTLANLLFFWKEPFLNLYIPLTYDFWLILAKLSQFLPSVNGEPVNPHLFHLANLLVHLGTTTLVFLIIKDLLGNAPAAALGALLFAIHPVQVEPVAWATAMKDLLSGFWSLMAIWQYIRFCRATGRTRRASHYLLAIFSLTLAILAKPVAVTVPLMAGLVGWLLLKRRLRRVLIELSPWLICVVPVVLTTTQAQTWISHIYKPLFWQRLLVAGDAITFYLSKLLFPLTLGPDYGRLPELVLAKDWVYLTGAMPYALAAVMYWKAPRPWLAAAGLFLAPLLPVLGLQSFAFQAISTVADRYLYLAMLGPALGASLLIMHYEKYKLARVSLIALLAFLAIKSTIQTGYWKSPREFEAHAIEVNPQSWHAYLRQGVFRSLDNRKEEAIIDFKKALAVKPDFTEAYYNLGVAYSDLGQGHQALDAYQQALYLSPRYVPAALGVADHYREDGKYDWAIMYYLIAVDNEPGHPEYYVRLGECYALTGKKDKAIANLRQALELQPDYSEAYHRLGDIYQERREYDQAIALYRRVLILHPDSAETYNNLGIIYHEQGKVAEAAASFQQALAYSPGLPSAMNNLALLTRPQGR